jgi:2'-5' RNA ligase
MTGVRTFVAVPLPEPIRAALFTVTGTLAQQLPGVRWLRKMENFHITVRFLGQVAEGRVAELGTALSRALGEVRPFEIGVSGIGAFPSAKQANVIWAGVDDAAASLAKVAERVERVVVGLGIAETEARPFRAHVTVGRSKLGVDARAAFDGISNHTFGRFVVGELHLYESQRGRGTAGSTYVLRSRAALLTRPGDP